MANDESDDYEWGECAYCSVYVTDDDWITDAADPTLHFCSQTCNDLYYRWPMSELPESS